MMLNVLMALMLGQGIYVGGREPRAASPWIQSVRASCGHDVLAIDAYGVGAPQAGRATLRVNGRPLVGEAVRQLRDDLSHRRAVYRLQVLCEDPRGITLRINEGERQADGHARYWSGAAFVRGDRLVSYSGLQEGNDDSFWFG